MPKEDRKVRNVILDNREMAEELAMLKKENVAMREQLEELAEKSKKLAKERGDEAQVDLMQQTFEQLSIF